MKFFAAILATTSAWNAYGTITRDWQCGQCMNQCLRATDYKPKSGTFAKVDISICKVECKLDWECTESDFTGEHVWMYGEKQATWSPTATNVTIGHYPGAEAQVEKAAADVELAFHGLEATPEWKQIGEMEMGMHAQHGADIQGKVMAVAATPEAQITQQMIQNAVAETTAVVHETPDKITANKQRLMATRPEWEQAAMKVEALSKTPAANALAEKMMAVAHSPEAAKLHAKYEELAKRPQAQALAKELEELLNEIDEATYIEGVEVPAKLHEVMAIPAEFADELQMLEWDDESDDSDDTTETDTDE